MDSSTATTDKYLAALRNLIAAASTFGFAAGEVRRREGERDWLADVRAAAAEHAKDTADVSGEALVMFLELDWLEAAGWALHHATEAQREFWNTNGVRIASELDARQ